MPMNVRHFNLTFGCVLACGIATSAGAQSWQASALPDTGGSITVVGCFQRGGPHKMHVLTNPTTEAVASVTEAACAAPYDQNAIELKDTGKFHLNRYYGQWLEITGRLEKLEGTIDADDVRELHVKSFRVMPVEPPRAAQAAPSSKSHVEQPVARLSEPPAVSGAPTPGAVGTSGTVATSVLPATASKVPAVGLLGLLSLAGAVGFNLVNRRRAVKSLSR